MKFYIPLFYLLECDCNPEGTTTDNNGTLICNSETGRCNCTDGYSGDKCNHCVNEGYSGNNGNEVNFFDDNSNGFTSRCQRKQKFINLIITMSTYLVQIQDYLTSTLITFYRMWML